MKFKISFAVVPNNDPYSYVDDDDIQPHPKAFQEHSEWFVKVDTLEELIAIIDTAECDNWNNEQSIVLNRPGIVENENQHIFTDCDGEIVIYNNYLE